MTALSHSVRREDGFTLAELLVAMGISIIVLLATLQSLDVFTSNAAQQSRATDANDQVRRVMDRVVSDLRGASVITNAGATDLTYTVNETAGVRTERLCVVSGELYRSSTVPPAVPPATCAGGSKIATLKTTTNTAFTYDGASSSASPALVKNVGLSLSLDFKGVGKASNTLTASAARRSAGTLPITDDDLRSTCGATGPILSLGAGVPNVAGLTVTYADDGGVALGIGAGTTPTVIPLVSGSVNIVATVTDALGVTNIIRRSVECNHP